MTDVNILKGNTTAVLAGRQEITFFIRKIPFALLIFLFVYLFVLQ